MIGNVHILSSFKITMIVVTDNDENVIYKRIAREEYNKEKLCKESYEIAAKLSNKMKEIGINKINVMLYGTGFGRVHAINAFKENGIEVEAIKDETPVPHHGTKKSKRLTKIKY